MARYYAQLKLSGHRYDWCGHYNSSVSAAVDCIIDRGGECGSYVIASEPCTSSRELNADEMILFDLAMQRKFSPRVDEALRRLEKTVA
jgi:hypothetical protein